MPFAKATPGLLLVAMFNLLWSTVEAQSTLTVPSQFPTIQSAINAANNGDQVVVAPGVYAETLDFNGKIIVVRSLTGATTTSIDAQGLGTAVRFVSGEPRASRLEGFTIRGGLGSSVMPPVPEFAAPGGVLVIGSAPTIRECFIEFNVGGAGIASAGPTAMAGGAGAIGSFGNSFALFQNCKIRNNTGGVGGDIIVPTGMIPSGQAGTGGAGAVVSVFANVGIADCELEDNQGGDGGAGAGLALGGNGGSGAVDVFGGQPAVGNSKLIANTGGNAGVAPAGAGAAGTGGVFVNPSALFAIVNCFVTQNVAGSGPINAALTGGIRKDGTAGQHPPIQVLHCTVADNSAGMSAIATGGIHGLAELRNTIVYGNGAGVELGGAISVVTYCNIEDGYPGVNNINANPLFKDSSQRDYHLLTSSPCRERGNAGFASFLDVDIDNDPRAVNGVADIGADEICLEGTNEDFVMVSSVNGIGDPFRCVKGAVAGDVVVFGWISPAATFIGADVVLLAQFHNAASLPIQSPILHPSIHLIASQTALIQSTGMLPAGGDFFMVNALAVPPGTTARVQAIVLSNIAANGIFASSRAHDIIHL
ncbi:MAG: hypothetical protein KDB53_10255 [Planctomycetes bacterium]|nr:hypothetical protein [Planctomycetota bacterium]